jgi:hypothetical protein
MFSPVRHKNAKRAERNPASGIQRQFQAKNMIKMPQPTNKVAGLAEQFPAAVVRAGHLHDQFRGQQLLQNLVEPA